MITEDDLPVIIYFDTSSVPRPRLDKSKCAYGWCDQRVGESQEIDGFNALEELPAWLTDSSTTEYQLVFRKSVRIQPEQSEIKEHDYFVEALVKTGVRVACTASHIMWAASPSLGICNTIFLYVAVS
jgi:hypothetical protein